MPHLLSLPQIQMAMFAPIHHSVQMNSNDLLVFEQSWVPFAYSIVTLFIVPHGTSHPEFLHIFPQNYFLNLKHGHQ